MRRVLLLALALLTLCAPARAAGYPLVVDDALLLSSSEITGLMEVAQAMSDQYGLDVVILTVDSIGDQTALEYAADWYDQNGFGQGPDSDGVMIMIAMESRDWCILTTGRGIDAFTDYAIDRISEDVVPYFSDGEYAKGFSRFLRDVEIVLSQAETGAPYDEDNPVDFAEESQGVILSVRTTVAPGPLAGFALLVTGIFLLEQTGGI